MILRFAAAVLVVTWIFWQVPFNSTNSVPVPELFSVTSLTDGVSASGTPALYFYQKSGKGQYSATGITPAGSVVRQLQLPGSLVVRADQTSVSLSGKEGYISGPENGAYFIWYPQLGSHVYMFNEQGNFLWEKEESRYLQVLPQGRFVLAAAGDHSRVMFMNPDFKVLADFQGVLFTRLIADDNPELKFGQACLGSLDGEVIIAHLDKKVYTRQKLGYALKSLACNFATGDMAVIAERTVNKNGANRQADFLIRLRFDLGGIQDDKPSETITQVSKAADEVAVFELPVRTTTASTISVSENLVCFVQIAPAADNQAKTALYYTPSRTAAPKLALLAASARGTDKAEQEFDRWKAQVVNQSGHEECLHVHPSGRVLVGSNRGLLSDRGDLGGERLLMAGSSVFLQRGNLVFGFR